MSWLNRKARNRRVGGREHVLDVKLRSDQRRASRMRMVGMALTLVFATILGFFLVWRAGEWALNRLIYENPAFAINQIDVQTDGVIAEDQLRRWCGVKVGENLLALDLARVKRDLEMVTVIRSVAVERVLPHTLRLRVAEREPLAQVYVPQQRTNGGYELAGVLQLDREGQVMTVIDPRQRAVPPETNDILPILVGINPNDLIPGRPLGLTQAQAALQLIEAFDRSPMSGLVDLRRIDVASPGILEVTTGQGSVITFSIQEPDRKLRLQELEMQLRRWHAIFQVWQRNGKAIATLDLSVPNNIPGRSVDANAVPPATPKSKNPQRNRRKNV